MINTQPIEKVELRRDGVLDIQSCFYTIQGEGPLAGRRAVFVRTAGCDLQCPACFVMGHHYDDPQVWIDDVKGLPLRKVKVGQKLLTFHEGQKVTTKVTEIMDREVTDWWDVRIGGNHYEVTGEHPFYSVTAGTFRKVEDLNIGEEIGGTVTQEVYSMERVYGKVKVLNLCCHPFPSYVVGKPAHIGMWVHNCDSDYTSKRHLMTIDELATQVWDLVYQHTRQEFVNGHLVVITGGEPFRQNLTPFVRRLLGFGYEVQIETNGTLHLPDFPYSQVTIVCSPKTPTICAALPVHAYKYVLDSEHVDPDDGLPTSVLGMNLKPARPYHNGSVRPPIYLQPMDAGDSSKNQRNMEATIQSCMKYGYLFCLQVQKYIGLD